MMKFGFWYYSLFAASLGIVLGLGTYIFIYAKGYSYLVNDPKACANCHVMQDYYDSWVKSSHHQAASCNDCHLPHAFLPKYFAKVQNGYNHSKAFTLQNYPEPIRITQFNLDRLQHNCVACHETLVDGVSAHQDVDMGIRSCTKCHSSTGHMHLD